MFEINIQIYIINLYTKIGLVYVKNKKMKSIKISEANFDEAMIVTTTKNANTFMTGRLLSKWYRSMGGQSLVAIIQIKLLLILLNTNLFII